MPAQSALFDAFNPEPVRADVAVSTPYTAHAAEERAERTRLAGQAARILARLQAGPATNTELAAIALKYTGRISELRQAGYAIEVYDRDHTTGVCWYRLATGTGVDTPCGEA